MSRIDMTKPGAHTANAPVEARYINDRAESYFQYLDACGQLLEKYREDIAYVQRMQSELRKERVDFLQTGVEKTKKLLENEGIPTELALEWIKELKKNVECSFEASEKLLDDFSMASMEEVKKNIKGIIYG